MDKSKLNTLALKAKLGCEESLWKIKAELIGEIHKMSNHNWHSIRNEAKFEESCFTRIDSAVRAFDPRKGNFYNLAMFKINSCLKESRKRFSETPVVISLSEKRSEIELESTVIDDSAVIDDGLMVNEKIALLAEGDPRKEMILKLWASGIDETKYIARVIAKNCGGKISSNRTYTHRFRARCRKTLA
ncbi:hypothetical protein ABNB74_16810 [Paenibacillus larvae]